MCEKRRFSDITLLPNDSPRSLSFFFFPLSPFPFLFSEIVSTLTRPLTSLKGELGGEWQEVGLEGVAEVVVVTDPAGTLVLSLLGFDKSGKVVMEQYESKY